jgi:hypothetical protein
MSKLRLLTDGELDKVSGGGYIQNAINTAEGAVPGLHFGSSGGADAGAGPSCPGGCHPDPNPPPDRTKPPFPFPK